MLISERKLRQIVARLVEEKMKEEELEEESLEEELLEYDYDYDDKRKDKPNSKVFSGPMGLMAKAFGKGGGVSASHAFHSMNQG